MLPVLWWDLNQNKAVIKDGAKMVNAVSMWFLNSVIVGNSYGGNYAMCGKAYDPRLILPGQAPNLLWAEHKPPKY
jgi:acetyl-CoA carboxylase carboxyltransferase component